MLAETLETKTKSRGEDIRMEKENNNRSIILHFAEEINAINDLAGIERSYLKNSKNLDKDICNMQVTLLTMCVNREIRISLDKNEDVKKFCPDIKHKYNKVNRNIVKDIKSPELSKKEKFIFEKYLNKIVGCLLSGIKHEELNSYEREERVRDNMKGLITHNVADIECTTKHGIEIPYMYILAWDLSNLYVDMGNKHLDYSKLKFISKEKAEELNSTSYIRNLHSNIIDYFSHISDNMIDILLHNESYADDEKKQFDNMIDKVPNCEQYAADEESWEKKVNYNKKKGILIKPLVFMKKISFEGLLPTIKYVDEKNGKEQINYKDNNGNFDSKRETLDQIPIMPKYIKNNFEVDKAMDMMVRLVRKESEVKEYDLSQEIKELSDCIINVCRFLLDTIRHNKYNKPLIFNENVIINYLEIIQGKANCLPRDDSEEKKQNYINGLIDCISKLWTSDNVTEERLKKIQYDDNGNIKYEHIACTYALKNCRNWIAHFKITQNYDIKFVVFLFAISVKVLFEDNIVGKTYSTYESNMWSLFEIFPIDMNKYEEINREAIINAYKKLCITAKNNGFKNKDSSNAYIEPQKLFVYLGGKKSKYILTQGDVGAAFWLSLHMRSCTEAEKIVFKNIPQKDINAYLIGIANIIQKESTILNM